jgi:hypothetical protein
MVEIISNWKAWVIVLIWVTVFVGGVINGLGVSDVSEVSEVSVDDPVGTLRFDEVSVALATDPDREVERIVGHVWRFEGPKSTLRGDGTYHFFAVDLGSNDGIDNRLYLRNWGGLG